MGLQAISPSRRGSGAFEVREFFPDGSSTFRIGAPVARDSDPEEITEHAGGATVTGLLGFAMQDVTSGVCAFGTNCQVAIANADTEFIGQLINVATIVTPAAGTHLGVDYGLLKVSNEWYVDTQDESNIHVTVTAVFPAILAVLFKVIPSVIGE